MRSYVRSYHMVLYSMHTKYSVCTTCGMTYQGINTGTIVPIGYIFKLFICIFRTGRIRRIPAGIQGNITIVNISMDTLSGYI